MRLNLLKTAPIGTIALALSIGLHGLLLNLPLPDRNSAEQPDSEQTESETLEPIAIRPTVPPVASPKPTLPPTPLSTPKAAPVQRSPFQETAKQPIDHPAPQPVPAPVIVPAPSPLPTPAVRPVAVAPSPAETPAAISPSPQPSISPSPELSPSPSSSPAAFTADFPHFENAQAGCYGLETCHQIEGETSFREVGRSMMAQLEAKGYTVRLRDDLEDDTGRKVYEVSKDEETQYLTVLSALDLGRTVYVLAAKPMTLLELQSGNAAETPEG